jgi:hypothetical protein
LKKLWKTSKDASKRQSFHPLMREMTRTTLYDRPCLPSIHGNATYSGLRNRIKHDSMFLSFSMRRRYSLSIIGQWSFCLRDIENPSKTGLEAWHISVVYRRNCGKLQWQFSYTSSNHVAKTVQQWLP